MVVKLVNYDPYNEFPRNVRLSHLLMSLLPAIVDGSTPNFIRAGTMSSDVPLPPLRSIGPQGEGELKLKKWGMVSFVLRTATISIFLSVVKCDSICMAQTCAHSGVEPSRSAKAFYRVAKKFEKNSNFSPFQDFTSLYLRNY